MYKILARFAQCNSCVIIINNVTFCKDFTNWEWAGRSLFPLDQNNYNYDEFINWTVQSVFEVLVELWFVGILFEEVGIFYHCLTLWHSYIQCNVMVQCNFFLAISSRCFRIDSLAAHKWAWIILTGGGFWHMDLLLFFRIIHHEFWPINVLKCYSSKKE